MRQPSAKRMLTPCVKCGSLERYPKGDCIPCGRAQQRAYYEKNKERLAVWAANNPEKVKAARKAYRQTHREQEGAHRDAWKARNPERVKVHKQNRRARKLNAVGYLSPGLKERLFALQKGKCACCGEPLGARYHMDHIMPLALGGTNTDDNIQLLRGQCNREKHAKHPIDYMQEKGLLL
jgi:CRISPR/Cas system Type II protein with McrA/HNH and RuvC-like nuclease domain